MTPSSLVKLVRSLSGPEKRYFKLQSKIQSGSKDYLLLFQLIDAFKNPDLQKLKQAFKKQLFDCSWENICIYLGKMLLDSLVWVKKEKDIFIDLLHQLQGIKILKERSLDEEAFKQVKKVQQKAARHQLHWIEYYCHRYELHHYSDKNFSAINDEHLVKMQMKGKDVLKSLNHIHDHYSLYELLKYRLIHAGKIVSEEGKKKLNDLMLSEMVLVAGKSKSFTSQKLHLLFQSFFFTVIGDYHSALKSFHQLNELLEKNEAFLDTPPLDYFSALNGIIDSLHMLGNKTEVAYYLDKLSKLDQPQHAEYFRYLVRKTVCTQQILALLQLGKPEEAKELVDAIPPAIFSNYPLVDEEKQSELYFYCSLVHFRQRNWRKAHLFLREIMNQLKLPEQLMVSKAIYLLNIVIYYEKDELLHLEYEIRAYKRHFIQSRLLKIEKLVFKIATASPAGKRMLLMPTLQKKMAKELYLVTRDRYEQQLLKYFDFAGWIGEVMGRRRKGVG